MQSKKRIWTGLVLCVALRSGMALGAQDVACPDGRKIGDLGMTGLYGAARDWTGNWELFRTEPMVRGVVEGGPADGVLEADDVIVAVDGLLITTQEAGRRLAHVAPGQAVTLTIRRDGEVRDLRLMAGSKCDLRPVGPLNPAPAPAPRASARPQGAQAITPDGMGGARVVPRADSSVKPQAAPAPAPSARKPAVPPPPSPQGPTIRFGFRLGCQGCTLVKAAGKSGGYWSFPQPPVVDQVEPGSPADLGGLRRGDHLTHIDGMPLTSHQGGRRLAEVDAGETVEWTYLRGGERRMTKVVTGGNAWPHRSNWIQRQGAWTGQPTQLRYSGSVGPAQVEVRGAPVNVTEDPLSQEIVIRTQDVLVRVKIPPASKD